MYENHHRLNQFFFTGSFVTFFPPVTLSSTGCRNPPQPAASRWPPLLQVDGVGELSGFIRRGPKTSGEVRMSTTIVFIIIVRVLSR